MIKSHFLPLAMGAIWFLASQAALAQTPDLTSLYHRFFVEIVQGRGREGPLFRLGQWYGRRMTPQEAVGLTDEETAKLYTLAGEFQTRLQALHSAESAAFLELRMRAADTGESTAAQQQQLRAMSLERQRQLVSGYIQKLTAELGAARSEMVTAYVRSRTEGGAFLNDPPVPPPGTPPAR